MSIKKELKKAYISGMKNVNYTLEYEECEKDFEKWYFATHTHPAKKYLKHLKEQEPNKFQRL